MVTDYCLQQVNDKRLTNNELLSSINLTKWRQQQVWQRCSQVMLNSLTYLWKNSQTSQHFFFFNEETKCKTNLYRKHKMKCMRIMGILYFTNITIFNENGDRITFINTQKKKIKINKLIISSWKMSITRRKMWLKLFLNKSK
jgi:hypothetical protein